ncbi:ABC transporter permease subunit [Salirhabdus sp. Marseille-P4669]|uniref:ABC transporter permease subunit n=1 Tax=Salirhabdus sp. Marseille-P4669 TaxID=2042310 RepID=UPI000C79A947|nr:ABC transporter permease subunit [Salirhabdus sp. Marseille-P4669]
MKLVNVIFFYLLGVLGILSISIAPQAFATNGIFDVLSYFKALGAFIIEFFNPNAWVYIHGNPPKEFPLLDVVWEPFVYSMQILLSALLLGFALAFVFAFLSSFLPKFLFRFVKRILNILESIPDLFIAMLLQLLTLYILETTGVKLFNVATYSDEKAYLGPILTLSILPMVSLFKILLLMIEEEFLKDYVVLAKSKGIKKFRILWRHIIKNITPNTFYHSKVILWGALSSQFIIERVFNVRGLADLIISDFRPMTIAISLLFIFTPFFIFYQVVDWFLKEDITVSKPITNKVKRQSTIPLRMRIKNRLKDLTLPRIRLWNPFRSIYRGCEIFFEHMKNWKFALGFLFFVVFIAYSLFYSISTDERIDQVLLHYGDDGTTLLSAPPHPPGDPFLLGSDRLGFSMWDQIVVGAKYTLVFALVIALLRIFVGFLFGTFYAFYLKPASQKWLEKFVDSIHFLPLSVIAYLLLVPILTPSMEGFSYSLTERIGLEILILTFVVVPLTSILIGNEMKQTLNQEFIAGARILGGSKFHILKKHVLPHIGARLTILLGQQFIQVLLIFIHLGVFQLFFGGTFLGFDPFQPDPPRSISYEWSGIIGNAKNDLRGHYWIVLWVLLAFVFAIFAMQLIIQGVKEIQQEKVGVLYKTKRMRKNKKARNEQNVTMKPSKSDFVRVYSNETNRSLDR